MTFASPASQTVAPVSAPLDLSTLSARIASGLSFTLLSCLSLTMGIEFASTVFGI